VSAASRSFQKFPLAGVKWLHWRYAAAGVFGDLATHVPPQDYSSAVAPNISPVSRVLPPAICPGMLLDPIEHIVDPCDQIVHFFPICSLDDFTLDRLER
jgi:hypothetical protein